MDNSIQAHQKELCNKLWAMANALRGNMEAYEFKNYILGMIFYYYLSDRTEKYMTKSGGLTVKTIRDVILVLRLAMEYAYKERAISPDSSMLDADAPWAMSFFTLCLPWGVCLARWYLAIFRPMARST